MIKNIVNWINSSYLRLDKLEGTFYTKRRLTKEGATIEELITEKQFWEKVGELRLVEKVNFHVRIENFIEVSEYPHEVVYITNMKIKDFDSVFNGKYDLHIYTENRTILEGIDGLSCLYILRERSSVSVINCKNLTDIFCSHDPEARTHVYIKNCGSLKFLGGDIHHFISEDIKVICELSNGTGRIIKLLRE